MSVALAFILYVASSTAAPSLTALAAYDSAETCQAAAQQVQAALAKGEDGATVICLSTDALKALGDSAKPSN